MSLPDTYRDEWDMARTLASYIDCPHRIRREVKDMFGRVPPVESIVKMRARHLAPPPESPPFRAHEVYDRAAETQALDYPNLRFVEAIKRERARCW